MLFGKTRKKPKGRDLSSSLKFNFAVIKTFITFAVEKKKMRYVQIEIDEGRIPHEGRCQKLSVYGGQHLNEKRRKQVKINFAEIKTFINFVL